MREGVTLSSAIDGFLDDLHLAGQSSTARVYKCHLRRLRPYEDFTTHICREIMRSVVATSSGRGVWSSLASFGRWCVSCGVLAASPMAGVPLPKARQQPHRFLSREELGRVYDACSTDRERLIVRLLLHGLRAGQLLALRWSDLRDDTLTIRAHKRNPVHLVALDRETVRLLETTMPAEAGKVAVVQRTNAAIIPLSYERVRQIVARIGVRARVRLTPHMFRHAWASQSIRAGMDSLSVQMAGGWADQAMVLHYSRSVAQEAAVGRMRQIGAREVVAATLALEDDRQAFERVAINQSGFELGTASGHSHASYARALRRRKSPHLPPQVLRVGEGRVILRVSPPHRPPEARPLMFGRRRPRGQERRLARQDIDDALRDVTADDRAIRLSPW